MDKELAAEFEKKFEAMRADRKFVATLDELDKVFFLRDQIQKEGFVSGQLSRQVAGRIMDLMMSWYGYLHGIIMPNPSSLPSMMESQQASEEQKEKISTAMAKIMELSTRNAIIGITKDNSKEGKFFDDALLLWSQTLKPLMQELLGQMNGLWQRKTTAVPVKQKRDSYYG